MAAGPTAAVRPTNDAFLAVLLKQGASSRAQIARATGISKPTISEAAARLLKAGILVHCGTQMPERGRPMELYDINPDYGHAVGVAIERGHVAVRAMDFAGGVAGEERTDTDGGDSVPAALDRARKLLRHVTGILGTPRLATAVAIAAPIDPRTSRIVGWPNSPFAESFTALGSALGIPDDHPLQIDNDVNWATVAEHRIGSMQNTSDFLYIYLGAGIGAGLFLSGRLHRGTRGLAGEIALTRTENGEVFMHKLARSAIGTHDGWGGSIDTVSAIALFDEPSTRHSLEPIVDDIARVIANITVAIDPGRIVLGGPLSESQPLVDALSQRLRDRNVAGVAISTTSLGRDAPLSGAANGALELARRQGYESAAG